MNTVPDQERRVPSAGRFDTEVTLLAAGADRSALGRSPRRGTGLPVPSGTHTRAELPCQVHDPDLWFADAPDDLERAKVLCQDCPAQPACLTGAIERREPTGVWGGQILDKGEIVTHKRPRGRPRKASPIPQRHPHRPAAAWYPPAAPLAPTSRRPPRTDENPCDVEGAA